MDKDKQKISELTRRDIVDWLILDDHSFYGRLGLVSFLKRIWPLQSMPSTDYRFDNAEGDIWQHMVNNNDWSLQDLLYNHLDIVGISDEAFVQFLELCVHPLTSSDPDHVRSLVKVFNQHLKNDGLLMRPSEEISNHKIYRVISATGIQELGEAYEVVLSFAGEDREYVEAVAEILRQNEVSIFYDNYEEVTLWGKNLIEHLQKVYGGSARYCVMFISRDYAEKVWPTHERRSAFQRAIESKEEYILPARFDDTDIPGLHKAVGYIDLRKKTPHELAELILRKLGRKPRSGTGYV
jgi:hypothetical protein